jgi:hypothetical protein
MSETGREARNCRSPSIDRKDVQLRDLHVRRLLECKDNGAGNVLGIKDNASLVEISLFRVSGRRDDVSE